MLALKENRTVARSDGCLDSTVFPVYTGNEIHHGKADLVTPGNFVTSSSWPESSRHSCLPHFGPQITLTAFSTDFLATLSFNQLWTNGIGFESYSLRTVN